MKRMFDKFPGAWHWLGAAIFLTIGADLTTVASGRLAQANAAAVADGERSGGDGQGSGAFRLPPVARVSNVAGARASSARQPAAPGSVVTATAALARPERGTQTIGYLPAALRGTARQVSHDDNWLETPPVEAIPLAPTLLKGGPTSVREMNAERMLPPESPVVGWQDGIDVGPIPAGWTLKSVDTLKLGIYPDRTHPQNAAEGILEGAPKGQLFEQVQVGRVTTWIAPNVTYQPLLFEDARLERNGFASPYFGIQPIRSGLHFTNSALLFPIRAVVYRNECESPLVFERPGNQAAPSREIFIPAIGW